MMKKVNAMGDTCPIPVVKTKKAIKELDGAGEVEILVDNEVAVQNLTKMANQKKYGIKSKKIEDGKYQVNMIIGEDAGNADDVDESQFEACDVRSGKKNTVVVISSDVMGQGDDELGASLMKSFIYALSEQDDLPSTLLFYNGGVKVTTEGSVSIEDLQSLEAQGVKIMSCGACLNFYGLTDKLKIGEITNMYSIVETMMNADHIVKPS